MKISRLFRFPILLAFLAMSASAQPAPLPPVEPESHPLWPDGSPNNPADGPRPTLEIYRPFTPARSHDATIVILPGGGYSMLSPFEKIFGDYFRSLGYTAVVVNYRVKPHAYPAAYADAQRALRLVRARAGEWKIPGKRVALYGGSAGGHLAALVATRPDFHRDPGDDLAGKVSARPDRLILLYPVISAVAPYAHGSFRNWFPTKDDAAFRAEISPELHVTKDTPPVILVHAADDVNVTPENSVDFARACWKAGVSTELHIYPQGGHGRTFAYDREASPRWRQALQEWLALWRD